MHEIAKLEPRVLSGVPALIRRNLSQEASAGRHSRISIKDFLLQLKHDLVEHEILAELNPTGGPGDADLDHKPFETLIRLGVPAPVVSLIYHTLWELHLQGILAPDPTPMDPADYDGHRGVLAFRHFQLTPYGVEVLSEADDRILVHDPEGYLANLEGAEPPPDTEMTAYLEESLAVFRGGQLRATVLLLHMASERLLDCLATALGRALARDGHENAFDDHYSKTQGVSARFDCVQTTLMGTYDRQLRQQKLKHGFEGVFKPTFHSIRLARNDIAHRGGRDFTRNEISGFLHFFAQGFFHANKIIRFLSVQCDQGH